MHAPRSPAALTVAMVVGATLAACSSGGTERAQAESTGVRARCVVGDAEGEIIVLPGSVTADGDTVLREALPQDPVNLEVVEQSVVAFAGRSTVQGVIVDYPPLPKAGIADSLARWEDRTPLAGRRLTGADGQQAVLVALRLVDPERSGHLGGVTLSSTRDGEEDDTSWRQPLLVEPPGELCTVADVDATRAWVEP